MKEFLESTDLLAAVIAEAEKNSEAARALAADLSHEQLNWKPSSTEWSMAQCLEHLAITSKEFDRYFSRALERGRKAPDGLRYRPTAVGGWLARRVNPIGGRNFPAPKVFRPSDGSDIHGALDLFLNEQATFIHFVERTKGIDYNRARLRSPVTPLMRYSLADALVVTVFHGRRHLGQAERVRKMPEFPRS
jgi:hypothetical protein